MKHTGFNYNLQTVHAGRVCIQGFYTKGEALKEWQQRGGTVIEVATLRVVKQASTRQFKPKGQVDGNRK